MSVAATILNFIGLTLSTGAAALLLTVDIRERARRSRNTIARAKLKNMMAAREQILKDVIRLTVQTNRSLDPERDRYSIDEATKPVRLQIEELQNSLSTLEDINQLVLDDMVPPTHLFAYVLLVLGFISQIVALAF